MSRFETRQCPFVMFLCKTLHSHRGFLQPGVQMGTKKIFGVTCIKLASHPGEYPIFFVMMIIIIVSTVIYSFATFTLFTRNL